MRKCPFSSFTLPACPPFVSTNLPVFCANLPSFRANLPSFPYKSALNSAPGLALHAHEPAFSVQLYPGIGGKNPLFQPSLYQRCTFLHVRLRTRAVTPKP
eukprot:3722758-Rhodomonas_salina.1